VGVSRSRCEFPLIFLKDLEKCAAGDRRSANGQMESLLRQAVARRKREPAWPPREKPKKSC
jgi:hypothetical protein